MVYLKSLLVGLAGAVVAPVLWVIGVFVIPIVFQIAVSRAAGSGGIGAVSMSSNAILVAALVGFVIGFGAALWYWQSPTPG